MLCDVDEGLRVFYSFKTYIEISTFKPVQLLNRTTYKPKKSQSTPIKCLYILVGISPSYNIHNTNNIRIKSHFSSPKLFPQRIKMAALSYKMMLFNFMLVFIVLVASLQFGAARPLQNDCWSVDGLLFMSLQQGPVHKPGPSPIHP